jgi:two-component system chemotaxis sensor kinase CheA
LDDSYLTPKLLEQFKAESAENLEHAEQALLSIGDASLVNSGINEIFRSIHTIKGSAEYLNLKDLKELSHSFETVLDKLRKEQKICITKELTDLFFKVLDATQTLVEKATLTGTHHNVNCQSLMEQLKQIQVPQYEQKSSGQAILSTPTQSPDLAKSVKVFLDNVRQRSDILLLVKTKLKNDEPIATEIRALACRAIQGIRNASQFMGEDELERISEDFKKWVSSLDQCKEALEFCNKIEHYLITVQDVVKRVTKPLLELELKSSSNIFEINKITESETVRVDQGLLDGFMNLVGELIVARNAFAGIQSKLTSTEENRLLGLKELGEASSRLNHITEELQRNAMEMRMVPVKTLFQKFPRIVRDLCNKTGKTVSIIFQGENTEIDKGIADQFSEPLLHIIRNAVDHGIESTEERKRVGKSIAGNLIMKASHNGSQMSIEITDDGAGIDVEKLKLKGIERGLLTIEQAASWTKVELLDLIFEPGFSTAAKVTDISGRGVGLDVVRTHLKKAKGTVSVTTELNQGTCFRLELPLTMSIMRALLVKSNQVIYAISIQDVIETVKISFSEMKSVCRKKTITLRGEVIFVEWLCEILGRLPQEENLPYSRLPILILQMNGKKVGLIVDSIVKQEEIVVKPLPEAYTSITELAGASILGNGQVILILDTKHLYGSTFNSVHNTSHFALSAPS